MANVAINGLGRIGRATLKLITDSPDLELVAVNDLGQPEQLAYLLRYDSAYGRYPKEVSSRNGDLVIEGHTIRVFNQQDPELLPWGDLGIDIVFECTGAFTNRKGTEKHLKAGAKKAILSAPDKGGEMQFVVPGVNESSEDVFSTASCTTNCITPVMEIMGRRIGIKKAILNTLHAYTSSQSIVDSPSKKLERGRAGAANLVPTSTGAAKATAKVLPQFEGKFDGLAVRAPIVVGSVADITFIAERETSVEEINNIFREENISDRYNLVLGLADEPIVSSDIIQDPHAAIVDLRMTRVVDGDLVKVLAWYDNEWGYAAQMVREAERLAR
ncbi:type I glyceraldehyde-3-phosphate dehydrogenase [Thiohalomonas denitrificans]|uniref:type I glyceraldehyde-3-phosphate dehydrogenase n=1 Tax=Thiohalomonas denitrificans TaxID=415747 RepID=UPI0026EED021|nr:glyceraldehyde 3-phosphate dehydrogenase NAD-binding domain-containing protein [Thiohalomonas denitrificans]